ncbi:MAG: nitrile hydratase subunit beta [Rhodospirillaceae bacterium]|jgi:nitrile hydratase subunit beta|nr:nitrile hydratase subunit beta [Rhodospirillaceae bacterium]MBT6118065.1 nitrile hydratase subunit beta [Rhodospirillaceae bacterium]
MTAAPASTDHTPRFAPGDRVRVRAAFPPGHIRTPYFVRGREGRVESLAAIHPNPEGRAYGGDGAPKRPVYRIAFRQADLWEGYAGPPGDTTVVDIFEHWLEPAEGDAR